jgi:rhamnosyl/mannosyltransferase
MGGVEQVIHHLAHGSMRLNVVSDVLSLTRGPSSNIAYKNYHVFQMHQDLEVASTGFSWQAIFKLKKLLQSYDVIHYHYPWPFMDILHYLLRIKTPSIVTYHSDIVKQQGLLKLYQPLQAWFLKRINVIVATSPQYLKSSKTLQLYRDKVVMVTYGLDLKVLQNSSKTHLNRWSKKLTSPFFLFVGVLRYYKGLQYLIEAAKDTKATIVIAGEGPMGPQLKSEVKRMQLRNVIFLGAVSDEDKAALLKLSLGFIFPSHKRSEAFGIALLEAAMVGKPMISCEIKTGTSYINQNGKTGLVVAPENPKALSDSMNKLLNNPKTCQTMGKNAKQRCQSLFTVDLMVRRYVKLYRSLVRT